MTADELVALFDLAPAGDDRFIGHSPRNGWIRVYGGQVLAQALIAAERTVAGRDPHSLHAYFLLGGDPHESILFEVERLRDGRSFTTRRVVARQKGEAIFVMVASFHAQEPGFDHAASPPEAPAPEACPDRRQALELLVGPSRFHMKGLLDTTWPIDIRPTDLTRYAAGLVREPRGTSWTRIGEPLPSGPAIHRAALLYLSDMSLLETALSAHGASIHDHRIQIASLDHALWFHRPARADDWLLYVRGLIYTRGGVLVASIAQEGLMRRRQGA